MIVLWFGNCCIHCIVFIQPRRSRPLTLMFLKVASLLAMSVVLLTWRPFVQHNIQPHLHPTPLLWY